MLPSPCHHSSRFAATAATPLLPPRCCHSSCNAAIALLPQQSRCRHSSRIAATAAVLPPLRHCHSRALLPKRVAAVAAAGPVVATAAATLPLRPCCSSASPPQQPRCQHRVVAKAVHHQHSSHIAAITLSPQQPQHCHPVVNTAAATLPQQLQRCPCVAVTAAESPPITSLFLTTSVLTLRSFICMRCCDHDCLPPPSS